MKTVEHTGVWSVAPKGRTASKCIGVCIIGAKREPSAAAAKRHVAGEGGASRNLRRLEGGIPKGDGQVGKKGVERRERSKVTIEHEPLSDAPEQTEDGKGIPGLEEVQAAAGARLLRTIQTCKDSMLEMEDEVEEQDSCQPNVDDGGKRDANAPKEVENEWRDLGAGRKDLVT